MSEPSYIKMFCMAMIGAIVSVPGIALGYYTLFLIVTFVGN